MNQAEIYVFLRNLRKTGDNNFYTVAEIQELLRKANKKFNPKNFHEKVTRLWIFNFLEKAKKLKESKGNLYSRRLFRAKL